MVLPQSLQVLSLPAPASGSSGPLLPVHALLSPSNCDLQSPPAALGNSQSQSVTPSDVMRYDKHLSMNPEINKYEFIDPLERNFLDAHQQDSGNWRACVHPEGGLYFHDPTRGVYTHSILQDKGYRCIVDSYVLALMPSELRRNARIDLELVVQLGVEKLSHISAPSTLLKELEEVVVHSAETITTGVSLSPFDGDELSKILELINQLGGKRKGFYSENVGGACFVCVIARLMRYFTRAKFFNFCGLPAARLDADQTVYKKKKRNKLILVLSWAFNVAMFGAPQSHMEELRRVWVDRSISSPRWKNFDSKLSSEWSSITIYTESNVWVGICRHSGEDGVSIVAYCYSKRLQVQFLKKMTGSAFGTKAVATRHGLPYAVVEVFTFTLIITLATTGSTCGIVALFTLWLVYAARDFLVSTRFLVWLRASICRTDTA
ncbi:hypothetical protein BDR04DRAFT_1120022 [Suillus decipiens]|nr:hypothetical protein BDR04DRAFT_1120022 [Suillus decipiens]